LVLEKKITTRIFDTKEFLKKIPRYAKRKNSKKLNILYNSQDCFVSVENYYQLSTF